MGKDKVPKLTPQEMLFLSLYRQAQEEDKKKIFKIVEIMTGEDTTKE